MCHSANYKESEDSFNTLCILKNLLTIIRIIAKYYIKKKFKSVMHNVNLRAEKKDNPRIPK